MRKTIDYSKIINLYQSEKTMALYDHECRIKNEKVRYQRQMQNINDRYQKMAEHSEYAHYLEKWWLDMDSVCTQFIQKGHRVCLPSGKLPESVTILARTHNLKHPELLDKNLDDRTPTSWMVSKENYHKIKPSEELQFYCTIHGYSLHVSPEEQNAYWKN